MVEKTPAIERPKLEAKKQLAPKKEDEDKKSRADLQSMKEKMSDLQSAIDSVQINSDEADQLRQATKELQR